MSQIVKDQMGNEVEINFPPRRIISLVPSQTEFLFNLGLDNEIVGITKFCIHPSEKCASKAKVGGTKIVDFEMINKLQPDLIIANKEENTKAEIEKLQKLYSVWISDIYDLPSALEMMALVGKITGREDQAFTIVEKIKRSFNVSVNAGLKVAYFIWRKPYMTVGHDTFIHSMLSYAGFKNVFSSQQRYPVVNSEILKEADPDLIFLSSEPYPFSEKHRNEFKIICPKAEVVLVDGEYFSWYGSRLLGAIGYFINLRESILKRNFL